MDITSPKATCWKQSYHNSFPRKAEVLWNSHQDVQQSRSSYTDDLALALEHRYLSGHKHTDGNPSHWNHSCQDKRVSCHATVSLLEVLEDTFAVLPNTVLCRSWSFFAWYWVLTTHKRGFRLLKHRVDDVFVKSESLPYPVEARGKLASRWGEIKLVD